MGLLGPVGDDSDSDSDREAVRAGVTVIVTVYCKACEVWTGTGSKPCAVGACDSLSIAYYAL